MVKKALMVKEFQSWAGKFKCIKMITATTGLALVAVLLSLSVTSGSSDSSNLGLTSVSVSFSCQREMIRFGGGGEVWFKVILGQDMVNRGIIKEDSYRQV